MDIEATPDLVRCRVRGELDLATAHQVEDRLLPAVRPGAKVIFDMSALTFIDSTGVKLLVRLLDLSARDGWTLEIVPGPEAVQRVLEIVGLADRLPFSGGGSGAPG